MMFLVWGKDKVSNQVNQILDLIVIPPLTKQTMKKIVLYKIDISSSLPIPYADEGIRADFLSPAQDYLQQAIDLNKEIVRNPAST